MNENNAYQTAALLRAAITRLIRQLRKQDTNSTFSHSEMMTMGLLDQYGTLLPSELAEMEKVTAQAISQQLNRLCELGCITKITPEEDKRKSKIALTDAGRGHLSEIWHSRVEWLTASIQNKLTEEEFAVLEAAVPLIEKISASN
ncbi:MarR family transcriptional regulator [Pedobacter sp. HMF7647]|uniref:MarR family transcriptional regulator n=1 Tax=Hufsiella arboris TaxID=2695275 RepID=A0A7K1YDE1_9SPHI|nr:MarR family transcriptional regulator [Hufsiella arboris]MXV52381.1 MarR family transcriptional regulator [Hufsiella arboris]